MTDAANPDPAPPAILAPPPLIALLCTGAGLGLEALWPDPWQPGWPTLALALLPAGAALLLVAACFRRFRAHRTTANPYTAAATLVADGPFARSRNPMYLALLLLQLAPGIASASLWVLAMLLPCALLLHHGVIRREEVYLRQRFGAAYEDYCARVPRWW